MADRFRIVTIGKDGRARLVEDLEVVDVVYTERDTRAFTPGAGAPRTSSSSSRHGGAITNGELVGNGTIAATLAIKGPDHAAAAANVERLLERVRSSRRDLFIEWRPEALAGSAYSAIRGPGTATPAYRWVEWAGGRRVGVPVSWPVAPLPQALPLAIYERFDPPGDVPGGGVVNLLPNPNAPDVAQFANNLAWPRTIAGTVTYVDPAAGGAPELGGPGRGQYVGITTTGAFGVGVQDLVSTQNDALRTPVVGAGWYAVRARIKVRTPFVNVPADGFRLTGRWHGAGGLVTLATSANVGTFAANAIVDLVAIVQAPASAAALSLGLELTTNNNASGALNFGRFMVSRVAGPTSPAPAYVDGESDTHRWTGVAFGSRSVELAEGKLADYRRVNAAPLVERVASTGLYQRFAVQASGAIAHTARHPIADGEVLVGAVLRSLDNTGGYSAVVAPGIRYRPDDGRYLWANLEAGNLSIVRNDGTFDSSLTSAAITSPPTVTGRPVYLILRAEGHQLTAEWYGSTFPNYDRSNYVTRVRYTLTEEEAATYALGPDRPGYPMPRARGMLADGSAELVTFDWRPYTYTEQKLPATVPLRGVPGTAPALLTPAIGIPAAVGVVQHYAAFGWARKLGRHNFATTGDCRTLGGWSAIGGAGLAAGGTDVPAGAPVDVEASVGVTAHASTSPTGAVYRAYGNFQRGRVYTLDLWVKTTGENFRLDREDVTPTGSSSLVNIALAITPAQGWTRYRLTQVATANLRSIGFQLTTLVAGTGAVGRVAAINVYEGTTNEAPTTLEQTNGRGGAAPLHVIAGTATIDQAVVRQPTPLATEKETLLGLTAFHDASMVVGGVTGWGPDNWNPYTNAFDAQWLDPGGWRYYVDPLLIGGPDFAGDTIDVVVFALGLIDVGVGGARMRASAVHEHDPSGSTTVFTREWGRYTRPLVPFSGKVVSSSNGNPAGYTCRLGTLSLPRRRGRMILGLDLGYDVGNTAGAGINVHAVVLVPAGALASTPTGKQLYAYPPFAPNIAIGFGAGATKSNERRVRPDGSAITVLERGEYPYGTIGGELMEVEPGDAELLAWCYDGIPDEPGRLAHHGLYGTAGCGPYMASSPVGSSGRVSVDVTPRYRLFPA